LGPGLKNVQRGSGNGTHSYVRTPPGERVLQSRDGTPAESNGHNGQAMLLQQEICAAVAREQQRISQDLHDGLTQHLLALRYAATALHQALTAREQPEASISSSMLTVLDEACKQLGDLRRGLYITGSQPENLTRALAGLAARISERFNVDCRFEGRAPAWLRHDDDATHLYRIALESVVNAIRHGRAQRVDIRLECRGAKLSLSVSDDGIGLNGHAKTSDGMGMRMMEYRARAMNGRLTVRSKSGKGTHLQCAITKPRKSSS